MTGEAQGISEQDRQRSTVAHSLRCIDCRQGIGCETRAALVARDAAMAALADRDRELAELRAKIADTLAYPFPPSPFADNVLTRVRAALASSGSAPTGQEER